MRSRSMSGTRDILVVVHGEGRGRDVPTGRVFMDRLRSTDPAFAARFRFHPTGSVRPSLSGVAVVLFWLGDPLEEKYPECYREAVAIADEARAMGIILLNSPESLCNTTKTRQAHIWERHRLPAARARSVRTPDELVATCRELGGACIVRSDLEHAQRDVMTVRTKAEIARAAQTCSYPAAVVQMFDIRGEYRLAGASPGDLFGRFHHKARAFVFGDSAMASHLFFSRHLVVGLSNSLFAREARPRRTLARRFGFRRGLFARMIHEDRAYFDNGLLYRKTLVEAVRALGLDFAAVDYSIRPDGSIVLWEANPYFYLPRGEESVLSDERGAVNRVNQSLDWMAGILREIADARKEQAA